MKNLILFVPLIIFLSSKRFRGGLSSRTRKHKNLQVRGAGKWDVKRIFVVPPKVLAYYLVFSLFPTKLGFFSSYGYYANNTKTNRLFWLSLILTGVYGYIGWTLSPPMTIWWFLFIGLFSQYIVFGMFTAERYTYIANVGFSVLICEYFANMPTVLTIIATLWFYRSWIYVKAFKNNMLLFSNSCASDPECAENFANLGAWHMDTGRPDLALHPLMLAEKLCPYYNSTVYRNIAWCCAKTGNYQAGLDYIRKGMKKAPLSDMDILREFEKDMIENVSIIKYNQKRFQKLKKYRRG